MKVYTNDQIIKKREKRFYIIEELKLICIILISIAIVYNISLIVQAIIRPEKTPNFLGIKTFSIISGSMMPEINVGDIVIVKEVPEDDLKVGDIISYRDNSEIITHRIVKIDEVDEKKFYITKGDNNNVEDSGAFEYSSIEGKVFKVISKVGLLTIFLKNKIVIIFIMVIFVCMYLIDMKIKNRKIIREKKKELYEKKWEE